MAKAALIHEGRRYPLLSQFFSIGREDDCDLFLDDDLVSRRHALIAATASEWFLVDLKSSNGLLVNDRRVREGTLVPGDRIRIGEQELLFVVGDDQGPSGDGPRHRPRIRAAQRTKPAMRPPASALKEDLLERHLKVLYRSLDLSEVFETILTLAMRLTACDRGLVVARREGKLKVVAHRSRDADEDFDPRAFHVRAVVDRVSEAGEALLTSFGSLPDKRPSEGTRFLDVESILCVPMSLDGQLLGHLYVENKLESHAFTDGDLEVLALFAGHAATAMDNAVRHGQAKEEKPPAKP